MKNNNITYIKKSILDSFRGLYFDEDTHTYTWNGNQLISTTTYIGRFSDSFDPWWPSESKGKKNTKLNPDDRRTGQYYRQRWKFLGGEASNMGNRVHLFAESYPNFDLPFCPKEQGVLDFFNWLPNNYSILFSELRVFDREHLKAGTIDCIAYNKDTGKLVIIDWKTNNRSILEYYNNKKLKSPFNHLKATNLNKYSLQLSDYANILNNYTDYEVEEIWVIWLSNKKVYSKDSDRNKDYHINKVKPFLNEKNFKIFKLEDYTEDINNFIKEDKPNLVKDVKKAKPKKGLFSKKTKTMSGKRSLTDLIKKDK